MHIQMLTSFEAEFKQCVHVLLT